ncbi:MAG: undecaprenyldiphospho-muramoylpentapeptide beta-N-acetylglucosaminyltransferase [Kiritimatiellae bacterium]|nr:undecaprenyldiphospho-muramoylpentapeptide beta-N-acetylglucosaminyltransferase [Kiritimatiellia bacterium]MDW8458605.1 undecaprenyldiphospho-muramoylpentapeptide beta-N-acetylglucosaminyltransferase [Verrucomicrobiota bacterium]
MNIAVACGGTGGHIFPGLATAQELVRRGHRVTLWLAGKSGESEAVAGWAGPVVRLRASGFDSRPGVGSIRAAWSLLRAAAAGRFVMAKDRPDVVLAMGSYASVGPVLAARSLGVPAVLHESNVVPGRAIRFLAPRAAAVAISFEASTFYLRRANLVLTGMPLRAELIEAARSLPPRSFNGDRATVLVMGGSGGAKRLNEMAPPALAAVAREIPSIRIIHITGRGRESEARSFYDRSGLNAEVLGFTTDMARIYSEADFAICRAGAATCAELSLFGLPALLVPYPHAVADHQTANAQAMVKLGAADMVADADLAPGWLQEYLLARLRDPAKREAMSRAARARAQHKATAALADLVERCAA